MTRHLAGTGCDSKTIVAILDETEHLADIAIRQDADEFDLQLAHIGQKFPAYFGRLREDFKFKTEMVKGEAAVAA